MISREEMHQEFILRENIQKSIKNRLIESNSGKRNSLKEEMVLRSFIRSVLSEAVQSASSDPHSNTGINFLTTLFRNTSFLSNLEESKKKIEFPLPVGSTIFSNNYFWLHGRKPFKENTNLSRELLRIRGTFFN